MKKIQSVCLVVLLLLVFPVVSRAGCSGGICADVKIQEMQVNADGIIFIQTNGIEKDLTSCTAEADVFLKLNATTDGGKNIFSSLLSYQIADRNVNVRLDPAVTAICEVIYVTVK